MTIWESINHIQQSSSNVRFEETFEHLTYESSLNVHDISPILECLRCLADVSERDSFSFSLIINENSTSVNNFTLEDEELLTTHYNNEIDEENNNIQIEVRITKKLENRKLSVYTLNQFFDFVHKSDLKRNLSNISAFFDEYLIFEVHHEMVSFGSESILFQPHTLESAQPVRNENRGVILTKINDHVNVNGGDFSFLPSDFYLKTRSDNSIINSFFDCVCSTLSIFTFANNSVYSGSNEIRFKVNGYRSIITEKKTTDFSGSLLNLLIKCTNGHTTVVNAVTS